MILRSLERGLSVGAGVVWLMGALAARQEPDKPGAPQPDVKSNAPPRIDNAATLIDVDDFRSQFGPDRQPQGGFSLDDQLATYSKRKVETQDPFYIAGREMYVTGPLQDYANLFGDMNPAQPHLMVYGDWRTAVGFSDNGGQEVARLATRLNLDIDFKMTATERLHAFVRPFDQGGRILSTDFGGNDGGDSDFILDGNLDALFFEGDVGPIVQGISGRPNEFDLPFAVGKMPLLFQNGVWVEDAFTGVACTLQAKNSPTLDIANADVTFFAAFDDVTTGAVTGAGVDEDDTNVVGVTSFVEAYEGYAEVGYGYTFADGRARDADYHNLTAAWTRRYWHFLSNSLRLIVNFGQDQSGPETADGGLFLCENSFGTRQPYTLIPYFNVFAGVHSPQSLARAADAGGVLKNTGINFETDGLTLFPKLDDTGRDAWGAALGVEYLPNVLTAKHRQQIVLELAGVRPHGSDASAMGDELALGARYQVTIDNSWIFRCDAMVGWREDDDELAGVRMEIRKKF